MKIDLITVFPGIILETQKSDWGKKVPDPDAYDDITYNGSRIISYNKAKSESDLFNKNHIAYLEEAHNEIIDADGNNLSDYTIIYDKDVEVTGLKPPIPDAQQLLSYFAYQQILDHWISIDFIKIVCFHGGGYERFINNQRESWSPQYLYLLPIEQRHKPSITLHKNRGKLLLDVFSSIFTKNPETYSRLINAISLFNESCRINQFSPNSAIVLTVAALESLLSLPRYSKKDNFSYAIRLLWGFDDRVADWANDLYALRSQIVHGGVTEDEKLLASKDRHYPHIDIARDMFQDCLLFVLEGYGEIDIYKKTKFEKIRNLRNKIVSNREKIIEIMKNQYKYTYDNFAENRDLYKEFILRLEELTSTDYSGRENILQLLGLIKSIAEEWINVEKKVKYKTKGNDLEKYIEYRNGKFSTIMEQFTKIERIDWSIEGRFALEKIINDLAEEVRQLEPIVHEKDMFSFTITEFLDRCFRALFAVY